MEPIKIGIITCANATQDMDCCSVSCLKDFNSRAGAFKEYPADAPLELTGIISCAGCPTRAYPEKILKRVGSLAEFGVQYIHFANCLMAFCPFIARYSAVIKEKYPEIRIIEGTHESNITRERFREMLACAFDTNKNMTDIIRRRV